MGDDYLQWNIRGIRDKARRGDKIDKIVNILENAGRIKILNIQETHLLSTEDEPSSFKHFKHLFHIIHNFSATDDRGAGICIFINKTEIIEIHEDLIKGRLTYLKLCNTATGKIKNIFSYYGKSKNSYNDWKQNFEILENKIMVNRLENIIIIGDFNFVTSVLDRNTNQLNAIDNLATSIWSEFQENSGIIDSFRITNPKRRLYTYYHTDNRSKSRIDRIYLGKEIASRAEASNFEVTNHSDHKIVRLRIGNQVERGSGSWIFNNSLLNDPIFVEKMKKEIRESEGIKNTYVSKCDYWDYLKMNMQSISIMYSSEKAQKEKYDLYKINNELEKLEQIPANLLTDYSKSKIIDSRNKIADYEKEKIEGMKLRAKLPTYDFGEPNIAYLAKLEKLSGERNTIYSLKDEGGNLREGKNNLLEIIETFYKKLYTKEHEDEREQDKFLEGIITQITDDNLINTERVLEEGELYESLKGLQKNKSPGYDGLTVEYFLFFWNELKQHYLDCITEIIEVKELSEMQKRGAIRISFKKGNRDELKNYRPITLLNVDLKIITHTLAKRLAKVIPILVHKSQKAVPGRKITDNIHVAQDLINLINKNKESAAFIFYDQEKAFDRMSHSFIIKTLKRYGFGNSFISWVKILFHDIKSFVKVNGFETSEFDVQRGVRQGCGLSSLLYVLVSEVLAIELRNNRKIKGYKYFNKEYKLSQYADDLMTIVTDINSIGEIFDVFKRYEVATNAKINKAKTEALWVGGWRNRTDTPFNIRWKKDYVKFLGVYVGNITNREERMMISRLNFEEVEDKIKKKLSFWNGSGISIKGKIRVVNTFVLPKIFYRLECVDLIKEAKLSIERKIRQFLWNERRVGRINFAVLTLQYENGGLNLLDIENRVKVSRIKWLLSLISKNNNDIERFIADKLIGNYRDINGLKILNHDIEINKFRGMDNFYANAIRNWRSVDIVYEGASTRSIMNEIIFYNKLLVDQSNNTFIFFNAQNNQSVLPKYFKDLPVTQTLTSISTINRATIRNMNRAYWNLCNNRLGKYENNTFTIKSGNENVTIESLCFKQIYTSQIRKKEVNKNWEGKWNRLLRYYTLDIEDSEWERIWLSIHDNMIPYEIQSIIWELIHLNFFCGYKERLLNYGEGKCKLCGETEEGSHHIVINCRVLELCMNEFTPIIMKFNTYTITKDELAFGLAGANIIQMTPKDKLRHFITFIIRAVVFKNRNIDYGSTSNAVNVIKNKIKLKIMKLLSNIYNLYKYRYSVQEFLEKYLIENIIGRVENGKLNITI